jgi:hypothetical protein
MEKATRADIPTLRAVWDAATAVNIPRDRAEWTISWYAERNTLMHSRFTELIQSEGYTELARTLHQDGKDLALIIPPDRIGDMENMSAVIDILKDKYFMIEKGREDDPRFWCPTPDLRNLEESKTTYDVQKAELVEAAVKKAKAAAKKREREAQLIEIAISGKRNGSQPFSSGEASLEKRTKAVEKAIGI